MNTLSLEIPDLGSLQAGLEGEAPFALWEVVEQPLLYHWLDYAIDHDCRDVVVRCPVSMEKSVRAAIEGATLWPIDIRLQVTSEGDFPEPGAIRVDHLPNQRSDGSPSLVSLEDLLAWYVTMIHRRLDHIWDVLRHDFPFITTGHGAFVHPDAVLEGPYWIGDGAEIEAGALVGAYSVIGHRSRVRAGASIEEGHVAADADVCGGIHLRGHTIAPGLIFNHRKRLLHGEVDPEIVRFRS